jgi:long-chain acyl-CoA synthetase
MPYGKQNIKRGGMWYTPVSGIWQTVWLESVPEAHITQLDCEVDLAGADITVITSCGGVAEVTVHTEEGDVTKLTDEKGRVVGEIIVKGENVMIGYYDNPDANAEVFTDDGWFRTGDLGYMDSEGYIYITGRKKSVIVLNNGKNVFPEEIEEYLGKIESIKECVVVGRDKGDGSEIMLTAVVFPDFDAYPNDESIDNIADDIKKQVLDMNRNLPSFKQIHKLEFRKTEFEKTTSRKIKRHLV